MTTGASSATRCAGACAGATPLRLAARECPLPATCGDDLERFWPTRRMDAFDEFCR